MALLRTIVTLEAASGIPADRATNTYWFNTIGLSESILDNVQDLMTDLYINETDAPPLQNFFANDTCGEAGGIAIYDMADPEPRAPIRQFGFDVVAGEINGLPSECTLCVSFKAADVSGEPAARRRGRVYIPFPAEDLNLSGRPTNAYMSSLASAFTEFRAAAVASANVDWVVYSRASEEAHVVESGWVDDAWDTQRRRGLRTTTRTFWG